MSKSLYFLMPRFPRVQSETRKYLPRVIVRKTKNAVSVYTTFMIYERDAYNVSIIVLALMLQTISEGNNPSGQEWTSEPANP